MKRYIEKHLERHRNIEMMKRQVGMSKRKIERAREKIQNWMKNINNEMTKDRLRKIK